jgi:alginate O-acetyltransferase complex protein AlgI
MGYSVDTPMVLNILLPLGISFYTFEAISYMVDVYRGKEPARNWLEYNYYIMYFPHLISGPIIRFGELVPQYRNPIQLPDVGRITNGLVLILLGYLFKVLIADPVAVLVEPVFSPPHDVGVLQAYLGVLAFTVQIYFDFMGYTHIARGISLLFNIELPLNFNHPYLADNISNFWERWHITLSRWIRDYLYFPLGGSKGTLQRTVLNLMVTMLICGAWHGAGWTFILWGGYHGMLLAGYHLIKAVRQKVGPHHALAVPMNRWAATAVTFTLVTLGWILFRAPDLASTGAIFAKLANGSGLVKELFSTRHLDELTGILGMLTLCFSGPWIIRLLGYLYRPLPFWLKVQLCCILAFICWLLTAEGTEPFIYFQF